VNLVIPLRHGLSLEIADGSVGAGYPTARLARGLLLSCAGESLAGEGVGFGVPILKRGAQTIFPGGLDLVVGAEGPLWRATATYRMNLVERLAEPGGGSVRPKALYVAKDSLAALHRRVPRLRGPLTAASAALRHQFGWVTTYEESAVVARLPVVYTVRPDDGVVSMTVDWTPLSAASGVTEVVIMNELGADVFDRYEDSAGIVLRCDAIGTWDEVTAARASFVSPARRVAFSLGQAPGARLFRGRELIDGRLAWAGFGYSCPRVLSGFTCDVRLERTG
jgi:hypothetical protein